MCPPGDTRRTIIADLLRGLHPAVVSLGLASQPELDALDRAVRSHLDDSRILVVPHPSILTWAASPPRERPRSPGRSGRGDLLLERVELRRAAIAPAPDHTADAVQVIDGLDRIGLEQH